MMQSSSKCIFEIMMCSVWTDDTIINFSTSNPPWKKVCKMNGRLKTFHVIAR